MKLYSVNIRQLLLKISRLAKTPTSETQLNLETNDWTEFLYGVIPLERLQETYLRTALTHKKPAFINAFDVLANYRELIADEKAAADKLNIEARKKMSPIEKCVNVRDHINARGDRLYLGLFGKFDLKLACVDCRRTAYFQQRERHFAKLRKRNARILLLVAITRNQIITAIVMKQCFLGD